MSHVAIKVDGIGKQYLLRTPRDRYSMLRETLTRSAAEMVRAPARLFRKRVARRNDDRFWALRDISFSVASGEIVGVIGGNGSGKSTLLKILSRVTSPTTGRAEVHGRLGSLLEVGTGFHPELSGRENILLNGAILGMRRSEIQRKFDAIVEFGEIERFLETPVKHYSSGMYLRLAFAVAAHLEPEILLIDEVLAVGDAAFQKKCIGRMGEVARAGRTVLFVSHNMAAVQSLCNRTIWLRAGQVQQIGNTASVVSAYLRQTSAPEGERSWSDPETAPGNEWMRLHRGRIRPLASDEAGELTVRTGFAIEIEYWNLHADGGVALSINLYNEQGVLVFNSGPSHALELAGRAMPVGLFRVMCQVPGDLLNDGVHRVELYVMRGTDITYHDPDFLSFDLNDSSDLRGAWFEKWPGAIRPLLRWETKLLSPELQVTR